ncbi:MAG TPA: tetratricopeptide repeat protein [Pyrinomonadaceae bacterium]|nr:tetratricopeptide repeat protein [Pyrinomonadaceae bacterium]
MGRQANFIAGSRIRYETDVKFVNVITSTIQSEAGGGKEIGWTHVCRSDKLFGHMKNIIERSAAFILVLAFITTPVWATCGGGGGGGGGGMTSNNGNGGGGNNEVVYHVPWKIPKEGDKPVTEGLILYWFPASKNELQNSSLRESRNLSLYASQCVTMQLADGHTPNADKLIGDSKLPVAVLANPDGAPVQKLENTAGKLKVADVEKLVGTEIKTRSDNLDKSLADAKAKADLGDKASAIQIYKTVAAEKCMFPKKAKTATAELKKLGESNIGMVIGDGPNYDPALTTAIVRVMKQGLAAENAGKYVLADQLYSKAHNMDPADPTPLRYLGELYRHDIGNWIKARTAFNQILKMPSDPLSTAVALHGLGKMTIHDGDFQKGLSLMEQSVDVYPIALAYRNLAVYWNSEGQLAKANEYTQKALELNPDDPYNVVFAAVYLAQNGKKDEALKIANQHIDLLPASYNLAAIFALNGQKEKALELLKRHFFQFERYQQVREKEMMEARVDAVFDSIRMDQAFLALTSGADGKLPIPMVKTVSGTSN